MIDLIHDTAARARVAAGRLAGKVVNTPLQRSSWLSERTGASVLLKREDLQDTGSFKLRGASNRLLTLSDEERARGCVAASTGNHGAAVARAMQLLGVQGTIFVPQQSSRAKVEKMLAAGATVEHHGSDSLECEQLARRHARAHRKVYLSPYNDHEVIAGQGTCGVEILEQCSRIDAVYVAVGGGGLIGGVGAVLKAQNADVRVVACQPEASAVMAASIRAGEILDLPSEETLSDGTAGGIEPGSVTFALNQAVVDEFVVVSEAEIAAAMRGFREDMHDDIEGAAGVAIAALLRQADRVAGQTVVVIVCGGNVSPEVLATIREL